MTDQKEFDLALDQFHDYLSGILKLYQDAVPVLKQELEAIMQDEIDVLNQSLKSQQALLLKTKDFDGQTAGFLSRLNIKAKKLTEMAQQLPEEQQLRFFDLLGEFELTMTEVKYYKEKCRVLLQSKLYNIDKTLAKQDLPKDNTTYDQNAAEVHGSLFPKSFEKKI